MIKIENVTKSYQNKEILKSISVEFNQGAITTIIGPSGTGKTTLMRCIAGLEEIDRGHIELDGEKLQYSPEILFKYRSQLGMVFQNFALFEHLSVLDNITLALIKVKNLSQAEAEEIAREALDKLNCLEQANHYPSQLSGGQKQRVAIVRSLVMNPRYLIFDEPTSALDSDSIYQLIEQIKILKEQKITILIITHDLLFAKRVSDYIVMMNEGNIIEHQSTQQFFTHPNSEVSRRFIQQQIGEIQ